MTAAVLAGAYTMLNVASVTDLAPVYNDVPQHTAYPYVWLTVDTRDPYEQFGARGGEVMLALHIYSTGLGDTEVFAVINACVAVLDCQPITVVGHVAQVPDYRGATPEGEHHIDGVLVTEWTARFSVKVSPV